MARNTERLPVGFTRRKGGGLCYQFTIDGKRYSVYGKTIKECRNKADVKRDGVKAGAYKPQKTLTFREYGERCIENKKGTVKPGSSNNQRLSLTRACNAAIDKRGQKFGGLKLDKIERQNVIDIQKAMAETLSEGTVNITISFVRGILDKAVSDRIILWNPARGVEPLRMAAEPASESIHRALEPDEVERFLNKAKERNSWYYNHYIVLLNTGLRIGELGALTRADIDGDGITVKRSLSVDGKGKPCFGDDTKTAAGRRFVPLSDKARTAIKSQQSIEQMLRPSKVISLSDTIFKSPRGGFFLESGINYDIKRICQITGIERFTVHAFRATFATNCANAGMIPKVLMSILGHSDINMTMRLYAHARRDAAIEAMKAVNIV